jgi:signal transduction histidine kinase
LQSGGVMAAAIAAALDDDAGVSRGWQLAALGGLAAWSVIFLGTAVAYGLWLPLVVCDVAIVALLLLAQPRLVPVSAVVDETTWAIMLAGTTIYVAVLATGQVTGLLLATGVIAAYLAGVPAETSQTRDLVVQGLAVSAIMWLLRRGGRRADAVVASRNRDRRRALLAAARRADERDHRSQMHDSVLATLTMVASGAVAADSPALRKDARRALAVIEVFSGNPLDDAPVDLLSRLEDLVADVSRKPGTQDVDVKLSAPGRYGGRVEVPGRVAAAFTGAVGEALRNVAHHSGASRAVVRVERRVESVTVTVTDRGRGFSTDGVPAARQGIRYSIVERMALVGGSATVMSRPGAGAEIVLRWPRG